MIVLDSHVWVWWITMEHHRLPAGMATAIEGAPRVGVSAVSLFELALAHDRGRLELPLPPLEWFGYALDGSDVELIPLTPEIAMRAVNLSAIHRDPFDRIIIATAVDLDAGLASIDGNFPKYPELAGRLVGQ